MGFGTDGRSMFDYTYNCNVIGKLKIKTPIPYSEIRIIVIKPNDLYCKLTRCAFIIILIIHWLNDANYKFY